MSTGGDEPVEDPLDVDWAGSVAGTPSSAPGEAWVATPGHLANPDATARYVVQGVLGAGGMGRALLARDTVLDRLVALKEPLDASRAAPLAREASVLARLDHPGIIPIHDAGTSNEGLPFFVMPVIAGRSLADALAGCDGLPARLRLLRHLRAASEAVAHAHTRGVVHRDLKPSNILIGAHGETLVVDWGLAADREHPDPIGSASGAGTRGFRAPETAAGAAPDPRQDVHALGTCLFVLLHGGLPGHGWDADAPPELRAMVERARAPDPLARYEDADAFAADLGAWLDARPVSAYRYSALERLARWMRPRRGLLVVAGLALGSLIGVGGVSASRVVAARDRAFAAESDAVAARAVAERRLREALIEEARAATARVERLTVERLAAEVLAFGPSPEVRGMLAALDGADPLRPIDPGWPLERTCARTLVAPRSDRLVCVHEDAVEAFGLTDGAPRWTWSGQTFGVALLDVRGEVVVTDRVLGRDGHRLRRLALEDGRVVETPIFDLVSALIHDPSGRRVGTHSADDVKWLADDGAVRVVRPCDQEPIRAATLDRTTGAWALCTSTVVHITEDGAHRRSALEHDPRVHVPAPSALQRWGPDSLLVGTLHGRLARLDLASGRFEDRLDAGLGEIRAIAASPDGRAALVEAEHGVALWLPEAGSLAMSWPAEHGAGGAWGEHGGLWLAAARVGRWALPRARLGRSFRGDEGLSGALVVPDGRVVALGGEGALTVWDPDSGRRVHTHRVAAGTLKDAALGLDGGGLVLVGSFDVGVRWFDLESGDLSVLHPSAGARRVAVAADGRVWLASYGAGLAWLDPATGALRVVDEEEVMDLDASADGRHAAVLTASGEVRLLDLATGGWRAVGSPPGALAVAATGGAVWAVTDTDLLGWSHDGVALESIAHGGGRPTDLAIHPEGGLAAVGHLDGGLSLVSLVERGVLARAGAHQGRIGAVRFGADGRLLTAGWDGALRRWGLDALDLEHRAAADRARRWDPSR